MKKQPVEPVMLCDVSGHRHARRILLGSDLQVIRVAHLRVNHDFPRVAPDDGHRSDIGL
jgi:hypothetical protein